MKANAEIRDAMRKVHMPQWQLAVSLGVCENTVQRWLRVELPPDKKEKILNTINERVKK